MALTLPGHSAPAVGFEVPLEMLAACHGRVQHQCETLRRLITHLQAHGAELPPMATRLLGDVELDRIGPAMRNRRGVVAVTAATAPQP